MIKDPPTMQEMWIQSLGWEDPLEKGMATHSSVHAWRIPWTEEPGGLQSMGSQSGTRLSAAQHAFNRLARNTRQDGLTFHTNQHNHPQAPAGNDLGALWNLTQCISKYGKKHLGAC